MNERLIHKMPNVLEVFTDFICPWCYLAEKQLQEAVRDITALGGLLLSTLAAGAAAIALLFENFTTVVAGNSELGLDIDDENAIATLSRIWKKTLYGY